MKSSASILLILGALMIGLGACDGDGFPSSLPGDGDGDTDVDGDVDGDTDADGEWGGDADTDADADSDVHPPGERDDPIDYEDVAPTCLDGTAQVLEGLTDCESAGCLAQLRCCRDVPGSWVQGEFSRCSTLSECGWGTFGPEGDDVASVDAAGEVGWLLLSGDGVGEVGVVADASVDDGAQPLVTFLASLGSAEATCRAGDCRQALGVALTLQEAPSHGTGVTPFAGVVLDGELETVHLYVGGRPVASEPTPVADLSRPLAYGFRVSAEGRVQFWVAEEDGVDPASEPDRVSADALTLVGAPVRLAVFGRLTGEGAGRVGSLSLERRVCDVPAGFERVSSSPVVSPLLSAARVGRPAVIRRPTVEGAPFLMAYETEGDLALATSTDGLEWQDAAERAVPGPSATDYGLVARRAPALLYWAPEGQRPYYHLWFEGESEAPGAPTAIVHATSNDGLAFEEVEGESLAIGAEPMRPWRHHVGQPSVVAERSGTLAMYFRGRDPATGAVAIGRAVSGDGVDWVVDDDPVTFEPAAPESFERDGVAYPTAVRRGDVVHLWYTGLDGSRSSVGYAVGQTGEGGGTFLRLGQVLAPEAQWESLRVGAPAVLAAGGILEDGEGLASLLLWYQAGPSGRESIGLAARSVPGEPVLVHYESE